MRGIGCGGCCHVEAEGILLAAGIAHGEWTAEEYTQALELAGYEGGTDGSVVAAERAVP